jgi:hypothetical protein
MERKSIMVEGHGRAKLLTSWWPGSREEINRKDQGEIHFQRHAHCDFHLPRGPYLLPSNISQKLH